MLLFLFLLLLLFSNRPLNFIDNLIWCCKFMGIVVNFWILTNQGHCFGKFHWHWLAKEDSEIAFYLNKIYFSLFHPLFSSPNKGKKSFMESCFFFLIFFFNPNKRKKITLLVIFFPHNFFFLTFSPSNFSRFKWSHSFHSSMHDQHILSNISIMLYKYISWL